MATVQHKSLYTFATAMRGYATTFRADSANRVKKKVAKHIFNNLIAEPPSGTPVDTSRALSNWRVTSTHPLSSPRDPFYWGSHGSSADASRMRVRRHGEHGVHWSPIDEPVVISNLVDYIGDLAAGKSPQSPGGWIERAISLGFRQGISEARAEQRGII